ncbi:MAG: transcriptional regulator GcvA [Alphaproteobacteria bacterium]|nr:transcriptional regulator GcvA [Alphaproteobacteria bacterium]
MSRRLPPLNALRAFEAAARHLSVTKAADELSVTPAAVSHQVKALEDYLGVKLFRRGKRQLLLTEAGQGSLPDLRASFDRIALAMERIRRRPGSGILTVSTTPVFGAKWLVPRLDRFREEQPEIDVLLSATMQIVDFGKEEVDIAVRYGTGNYPGLQVERLLSDQIYPVCSPRLLEGRHPLRVPADLGHHTLLHDENPHDVSIPNWRMWLLAAGVSGVDATRGPRFDNPSLTLEAAVDGHGVALGRHVLVAGDLAAGRLVKPFSLAFPVAFAYFIVYPEAAGRDPKVVAFRDWLMAEASGRNVRHLVAPG